MLCFFFFPLYVFFVIPCIISKFSSVKYSKIIMKYCYKINVIVNRQKKISPIILHSHLTLDP